MTFFFYKTVCRKTAKIVPIHENINKILLFIFPLLLKVYIFASFKMKCFSLVHILHNLGLVFYQMSTEKDCAWILREKMFTEKKKHFKINTKKKKNENHN